MLFRKRHKRESADAPENAMNGVATGYEAVLAQEALCEATVAVTPSFAEAIEAVHAATGDRPALYTSGTPTSLGGYLLGAAASGARVAGITCADDLAMLCGLIADASKKGTPFVLHHACNSEGAPARLGHDSIHSVLDSGAVIFFASDMQQALDLGLIGRRVAEESLLPVVVVQDAFDPKLSLESLRHPDAAMVRSYLGRANDQCTSPTPAQEIAYGMQRRRIPKLIDVERPVAVGALLEADATRKSAAARGLYVYGHVASISDDAMARFATDTGRPCNAIETYRLEDAEFVVVAQGVVAKRLRIVADHFRQKHKRRVGVVQIVRLRPFPAIHLSRLLKGKKAVTVLDSVSRTYLDTGPLSAAVRDVIETSVEYGRRERPSDLPDHVAYRNGDLPMQYRAVTVDTLPADTELVALVENMIGDGERFVQLGPSFEMPAVRLPPLERLAQRIQSSYPDIGTSAPTSVENLQSDDRDIVTIQLAGSAAEAAAACAMLAEGVFSSFRWPVRSGPASARGFAASLFTASYRSSVIGSLGQPGSVDVLALTEDRLLRHPALPGGLRADGALIVATDVDGASLWQKLPPKFHELVRTLNLRMLLVKLTTSESTEATRRGDPLAESMILAGAVIAVQFKRASDRQLLLDACAESLERRGYPKWTRATCVDAMLRGADDVVRVDWQQFASTPQAPQPERMAPWTARSSSGGDQTTFDAGRFWQTVGYLYETGQEEATMVDPFLASGLVAARTSAFRRWFGSTQSIASFIPENCTGCGVCWSLCPDAALPATIQDVGALIDQSFSDCASRNIALTQLERVKPHLSRQAHQLVAGDARHEYRSLDTLLKGAFERILSKLNADESQEQLLRSEFESLLGATPSLSIARTDTFFTKPESVAKGSGLLLTIAVNPDACKACGLCVHECAENAMEMFERSPELVDSLRDQWLFTQSLPPVPVDRIERFVSNEDEFTEAYRLLDWRSYHTAVGGDSGVPGDGVRATVRLVASFVDSLIRPRLDSLSGRVDKMIRRLEELTDETVHQSLAIGDFEQLRKRLDEIGDEPLGATRLAEIVAARESDIDTLRLKELVDTLHDLRAVYERLETRRSSGAVMAAIVCSESISAMSRYPYNPFGFPWIRADSVDAVAVAEGMFHALVDQLLDQLRTVRKAELVIRRVYDPTEHDVVLESLSWHDVTDEEWALGPAVCVFAENTEDVLTRLMTTVAPVNVFILERRVDAIHGATPGMWPLARPDIYVHHGSAGYAGPMLRSVAQGLAYRGPALHRLYVCDPERDGVAADEAVERMRLAVDSRAFPLLRYDPSVPGDWVDRWTLDGNANAAGDWVIRGNGDGDLSKRGQELTLADWAVGEARYRNYFEPIARNRWTPEMIPLAGYLSRTEDERGAHDPFVTFETPSGHNQRMRVAPELIAATETALERWQMVQDLAGMRSTTVDALRRSMRLESEKTVDQLREKVTSELEADYKRRQELTSTDYHARLTQKLLALSGYAPGDRRAEQKLREVLTKAAGYGRQTVAVEDANETSGIDGTTATETSSA